MNSEVNEPVSPGTSRRTRLALAGDSLIVRPLRPPDHEGLERLSQLIRGADVGFTNLEIVFPSPPLHPWPKNSGILAHADPRLIDDLAELGFSVFSVANNHALDFSGEGLLQTIAEVNARGLVCVGGGPSLAEARQPRYIEANGVRISALATVSTNAVPAADPDGLFEGRAGVSPLRFRTEYRLTPEDFRRLAEIDDTLGTASGTRTLQSLHLNFASQAASGRQLQFLDATFVESDETSLHTYADPGDVADITRWIREARRQSDLVLVSMHCHEGAHGSRNSGVPADFVIEAAHAFIDAGADLCVGHGPHQLGGIEIYQGKPIFYSLGNLVFMVESVETLPTEFLRAAGLPADATAADFHDRRERAPDGSPRGFVASDAYWESILPVCEFADGRLTGVTVWPVALDRGPVRHHRGVPALAAGDHGKEILARLAERSAPFKTEVETDIANGVAVGHIRL